MVKIDTYKNSIVNDLFIKTADQNYVVARWSFFHGLYRDFYWNALHACEKYMKASLLLNGKSAMKNSKGNYSHNILALFREVSTYSPELLPNVLICPNKLYSRPWRNELLDSFVEKLRQHGDPNNRYAYFSIVKEGDHLFKLDGLVFLLRRLAVPLDQLYFESEEFSSETNRVILQNDPLHMPHDIVRNLPRAQEGESQADLFNALHRLNYAFERNSEDLTGKWPGMYSENAALYRLVGDAFKNANIKKNPQKAAVIKWMLENIHFSRDVIGELNQAMQKFGN